ncbi:MAG: hypothetical protein HC819_04490 [Cyclobacteriaceae bacterium]|nr:hypothetical protein [Cyclobacteriaceae bacterium]
MKRFLAISLLSIFLAGQINLTWATHFCGQTMVKSSLMLGQGRLDCGMEETQSCDIPASKGRSDKCLQTSCCDSEYYSADTDDFFNAGSTTIDFHGLSTAAFVCTVFDFSIPNPDWPHFIAKSPPLVYSDKQIWLQVFLI